MPCRDLENNKQLIIYVWVIILIFYIHYILIQNQRMNILLSHIQSYLLSSNMHYRIHKGTGVPVLFLHGWGGSTKSFEYIESKFIAMGHTVVNLDLWGFGQSNLPPQNYGIFDYANDISNLLDNLGYKEYYLIGHSFGGRIAILLGNNPKVSKIILVNSAGVKPKRSLGYYYKVYSYKLKKNIKKIMNPQQNKTKQTTGQINKNANLGKRTISKVGSQDYQNLSDDFKAVFVRVVNTHLHKQIKAITASTLIIWGSKDKDTPLYMAKFLHKNIANSGLIVFETAGHYSYVDHYDEFITIANKFLFL